jgi:hypothetical protein
MTKGVKVSADYGIVVRRASLKRLALSDEAVYELMEVERPFDQDEELMSFGPHFGIEAARELSRRLEAKGLVYPDDLFIFEESVPDWCELRVSAEKRA